MLREAEDVNAVVLVFRHVASTRFGHVRLLVDILLRSVQW